MITSELSRGDECNYLNLAATEVMWVMTDMPLQVPTASGLILCLGR